MPALERFTFSKMGYKSPMLSWKTRKENKILISRIFFVEIPKILWSKVVQYHVWFNNDIKYIIFGENFCKIMHDFYLETCPHILRDQDSKTNMGIAMES